MDDGPNGLRARKPFLGARLTPCPQRTDGNVMANPKATKAKEAKQQQPRLDPRIRAIGERVRDHLRTLYGSSVQQVLVYGDYARGVAGPDTVLDVAAVVDDTLIPRDVERTLEDLLFEALMEDHELVSAVVLHEEMYRDYASPLVMRLKEEGVEV